ncbi:TetR/AcrR family transcriptional regulator [Amycolatopsis sp. NPDC051903]|uniref:TetR/AcrR family transcriptional regulator n=1 Tax=Amycolatopsis sp. NPDC051903 TaxID=3363936 RepID=UPI0037BB83D5
MTAGQQPWQQLLPPQERGRARRAKIVEAATKLIDEHGPHSPEVTLRAIADGAGTSAATIYHYFPDVDSVIAAVAAQYMENLIAAVERVHGKHHESFHDLLDANITSYRKHFAKWPGLRELWFDRRASDNVVLIHAHYRETLTELWRQKATEFKGEPVDAMTCRIAIEMVGALWDFAFSLDPRGDERVVAEIRELAHDYYRRRVGI